MWLPLFNKSSFHLSANDLGIYTLQDIQVLSCKITVKYNIPTVCAIAGMAVLTPSSPKMIDLVDRLDDQDLKTHWSQYSTVQHLLPQVLPFPPLSSLASLAVVQHPASTNPCQDSYQTPSSRSIVEGISRCSPVTPGTLLMLEVIVFRIAAFDH